MMKIIGIIPARYKSSRFPGKPLADIHGKPMIWWVYQQCIKVEENTELELPYLYYLGYNVEAVYNDRIKQLKITESENGMLKVELPETESIKLTLKYEGTFLTKMGYFV